MSHVSDFTQSSDKILLDLVNHDNNTALTNEQVSIVLDTVTVPTTRNSIITVSAKAGSGYTGSVGLEYNRLDIQSFVDIYFPAGLTLAQGDAETISDLMPEIDAGLAILLTLDEDYEDQVIEGWTGEANETLEITIPMLDTSKVYIGSLTLTLDGNDIPLNLVITDTILDGLNLPGDVTPPAGRRQLSELFFSTEIEDRV